MSDARFWVLAGLEGPGLDQVCARLELREVAGGNAAWREGEASPGLWLLDTGVLRLVRGAEGESLVGRVAAPAVLCATSLFGEALHESSAIAEGHVRLMLLSRTAFAELLAGAPSTAAALLASVGAELTNVVREGASLVAARR